jgi:uncharacterized protein (UPF0332 family)
VDKAVRLQAAVDELRAANGCMVAAMNNIAGPYGRAYGRCVSDLYYACYHLARALLSSRGIAAGSHEAVQTLLALHFVKPAALPQDTVGKLNELMDKRHVADYKPHIMIGSEDIARFRPWIVGFVHGVLKLLGKSAPAEEAGALRRAADDFEKIRLE